MQSLTSITFRVSEKIPVFNFSTSQDIRPSKNKLIIYLKYTSESHKSYSYLLLVLQLYCPNGISPMGRWEIHTASTQGKPAATVTLSNLGCMLGVLVFPWSIEVGYGPGVYTYRGSYGTNVLSYTKLTGHWLSSSQLNKSDIFHHWSHSKHKDRLVYCVSVQLQLSATIHLTNSCLIKEYWRTYHLINEQTNLWNLLVLVYYEWLTVLSLCRLCRYQTTNTRVKRSFLSKFSVVSDWIPNCGIHSS